MTFAISTDRQIDRESERERERERERDGFFSQFWCDDYYSNHFEPVCIGYSERWGKDGGGGGGGKESKIDGEPWEDGGRERKRIHARM